MKWKRKLGKTTEPLGLLQVQVQLTQWARGAKTMGINWGTPPELLHSGAYYPLPGLGSRSSTPQVELPGVYLAKRGREVAWWMQTLWGHQTRRTCCLPSSTSSVNALQLWKTELQPEVGGYSLSTWWNNQEPSENQHQDKEVPTLF